VVAALIRKEDFFGCDKRERGDTRGIDCAGKDSCCQESDSEYARHSFEKG
jgi:hypothetical protein